MELKSRQWVVVWIAGFVVLGMMLYPPWVWTAKRRGLSGYVVYGLEGRTYAPIFHPPDARVPDVYKEHAKDKPYPWDLSTRLDGTRLVVQCLAVAVAAGLAIAVLSAWSAVAARLNASQKWTILTSAGPDWAAGPEKSYGRLSISSFASARSASGQWRTR